MKNLVFIASIAAGFAAAPVSAATVVTTQIGSTESFAAPAGATTVINFNDARGTAFEANSKGYSVEFGGNARRVETSQFNTDLSLGEVFLRPEPSDGTGFFAAGANGSLKLMGKTALSSVSLFAGSLDGYNLVELLDQSGKTIESFTGTQMLKFTPAYPGTTDPNTNRRITFTGTEGTRYYGMKMSNIDGKGSFEIDNLAFTAAVPEPATWAMMMLGFGMVAGAMRHRPRNAKTALA